MSTITDRMVCEIINPSDPYTLVADDFLAAAVGVGILGQGSAGLEAPDGRRTPVLFGWDEWLDQQGISDLPAYLSANRIVIAEALETVMIGSRREREEVDSILALIDPSKHAEYLAARHDRRRSSMNDFRASAMSFAAKLREIEALRAEGR